MWSVEKIHHKSDKYVKVKMLIFNKSGNICWDLNPEGVAKNFKIIRSVYNNWEVMDESIG